jgi:hypothetical protein
MGGTLRSSRPTKVASSSGISSASTGDLNPYVYWMMDPPGGMSSKALV